MTSNITYAILLLALSTLLFINLNFSILLIIVLIMMIVTNITNTLGENIFLFILSFNLKKVKYSKSNNKYYTYMSINRNSVMEVYLLKSNITHFKLLNTFYYSGGFDQAELNKYIKNSIDIADKEVAANNYYKKQTNNLIGSYKKWNGILTKEDERDDTINNIIK